MPRPLGPSGLVHHRDRLFSLWLVRLDTRRKATGVPHAGCSSHGNASHQVSLAAFVSAAFATVAQSCAAPPDNVAIVWKPTWYIVPGGLPGIVAAAVQLVPLQLQLAVPLYS